MNTPSYLVQRNNQTMVNLRPLYEQVGFLSRGFKEWVSPRIEQLNLSEGKDFETFVQNRNVQVIAPVAVAMNILDAKPNQRTRSAKQLIVEGLKAAAAIEGEKEAPGALESTALPLFPLESENPLAANSGVKIPVLTIQGRAAVEGVVLFRALSKTDETYYGQWVKGKLAKIPLAIGTHYVEYPLPRKSGQKREHSGFIFSIDAAYSIAFNDKQGKAVAAYLDAFRRDLAKQRLPTKGLLSDFIGLEPEVRADPDPKVSPKTPESDQTIQNTQDPTTPEQPQAQEVTEAPEVASAEAPQPEEVLQENLKNPDPESGSFFDLMVSFAQGLLQQAQGLAELHRQLQQTQSTVSALVGIEQEAARAKMGLHRGTAEIPAITLRDRVRHSVSKRAAITKESHDSIYKLIYKRLNYDYGISVGDYPRHKDETHLGLCERWGLLDKVWQIVQGPEFNQYAAAQPQDV